MFSKSATVYSNDPQNPKTRISVSCVVKQFVNVEPNTQVRLRGFYGDKIKKEIIITSLENEKQPLKITDITSNIEDKIKYKLKTLEKEKKYRLEIKNRSTEEGTFRGTIVLKTNNKKKPSITIPVYGRLRGEIDVKPKTLSFGTIDTTKEDFNIMSLKKRVMLKDVRGNGLIIKKIKPSRKWIMAETKKKGKGYTIVITLDKDKLPKGEFAEEIDLRTNYKKKSLVVNIKGKVI